VGARNEARGHRGECYLRSRYEPLTWTTGSRAHFPQQAGRDHRNPLGGLDLSITPWESRDRQLIAYRETMVRATAGYYGSGAGTFSVRDYRRRSDLCAASEVRVPHIGEPPNEE